MMGRRRWLNATRSKLTGCGLVFAAVFLLGVTCTSAQDNPDCAHGGPCSCGELYSINQCTGIDVNACSCGPGFSGPSLGTTFDCADNCCLPSGLTYSQACLGKAEGISCSSDGECASSSCVSGACAVPLSNDYVFTYQVDSFELSRAGGSLIDNFDDGVLSPWTSRGTAVEANGVVTLSNPAVVTTVMVLGIPTVFHESLLFAPSEYAVQAGQGSFVARSTWLTVPTKPGDWYGMALSPGVNAVMSNPSAEVVAAHGGVAGIYAVQIAGDANDPASITSFLVDPPDVTGKIVVQIAYDDSLRQITTSFSFDGGAHFRSLAPVAAVLPGAGDPPANFSLAGDPSTPPADCPLAPAECYSAAKSSLSVSGNVNRGKQTFAWTWAKGVLPLLQSDFGDPANADTSYSLCVYDQSGGAPVLKMGATIDPGKTCGTKPCWNALKKTGWVYKNKLGKVSGITKLQLKGGAAGKPVVQVQAKGIRLPLPGPTTPTKFFSEDPSVVVQLHSSSSMNCWGSTFVPSGTKVNNGARFVAKGP